MNRRQNAWIIAGTAVVIAALGWLRPNHTDPGEASALAAASGAKRVELPLAAAEVPAHVEPAGSAAASTTARPSRSMSHTSPPDPVTAPVIEQVRYWRQRMASGDPDAACVLVLVAQQCAIRRSFYAPWARAHVAGTESGVAEHLGPDCRGIGDADVSGAFEILLGSAQRGHVASAVIFAEGLGFSSLPLAPPMELRHFKANAPRLAWQAFDAGDSDAAVLLWRAYNRVDTDMLPLAGAIDPDPIKAHALDLLMADLLPEFLVGTAKEAGLSAAQASQARALHAQWRSTAFAQPKPPRYGLLDEHVSADLSAVDLCASDPR